jgi:enoyl-CoA hydratase/carnithine racemase
VVETERRGEVLAVRMNRPDRFNALNHEMRSELARIWTEFRHDADLKVAILTGAGRGFCAREEMKAWLAEGRPGGCGAGTEDPGSRTSSTRARWRSPSSKW